jgi:hypothetical protein
VSDPITLEGCEVRHLWVSSLFYYKNVLLLKVRIFAYRVYFWISISIECVLLRFVLIRHGYTKKLYFIWNVKNFLKKIACFSKCVFKKISIIKTVNYQISYLFKSNQEEKITILKGICDEQPDPSLN